MILLPYGRLIRAGLMSAMLVSAFAPAVNAQQSRPAQPPTSAQPRTTPQQSHTSPPAGKGAVAAKPAAGTAARTGAASAGKPAPAANTANRPGGAGAVLLASFGDWGVYSAQSGRAKICYALTQPKDRQPKNLTRDPGYLFVSFRPAENVRNEIALVMGFPTNETGPAEAVVGNTKYALLTKDQNAWLRNPAEETQAISVMSRGQNMIVKVASRRGNATTDRYSLNGFGQALERARKECP